MRRILAFTAIGLLLLALAAISFARGAGARAATVDINVGSFYFCNDTYTGQVCQTDISVGDTVNWHLVTGTHSVTECDDTFQTCPPAGGFDSPTLDLTGETFSHTFNDAGAFEYWCRFHPDLMRGRIVVTAQPTATPTPTATQAAGSPTPTPTSTAPTVTPASAPVTGGPPSDGSSALGTALLAVLGVALLVGSAGLALRAARRV